MSTFTTKPATLSDKKKKKLTKCRSKKIAAVDDAETERTVKYASLFGYYTSTFTTKPATLSDEEEEKLTKYHSEKIAAISDAKTKTIVDYALSLGYIMVNIDPQTSIFTVRRKGNWRTNDKDKYLNYICSSKIELITNWIPMPKPKPEPRPDSVLRANI